MFEAGKKSNDFVILTSLKSGVFTEIPVDSLVRGIRLGLFSLKQKQTAFLAVYFYYKS